MTTPPPIRPAGPSYLGLVTIAPHLAWLQDSVLRRRAMAVDFDQWPPGQLRKLADEMLTLLGSMRGDGLAAPQVGLSLRLAVIGPAADSDGSVPPSVLVNPVIVESSETCDTVIEGCLSLPGFHGEVRRPTHVTVRAYGLQGEAVELTAAGRLARTIQHEMDHLDGILYLDHLVDGGLVRSDAAARPSPGRFVPQRLRPVVRRCLDRAIDLRRRSAEERPKGGQ